MASWPALPFPQYPLNEGIDTTFPDVVLKTSMDTGRPKRRRKFTAGLEPVTWPMLLSDSELDTFRAFWQDDCGMGSLPFTHVDVITGATVQYTFAEPPKPQRRDLKWFINLKLEILP